MKFKLPNEIISPQDVKSVSEELNEYARQLRSSAIKKRVTNKNTRTTVELKPVTSAVLSSILPGKEPSPRDIEQAAKELNDYLKKASVVRIILADIPSFKLKHDITSWCREQLGGEVLVDFRFNSTLLGGMVVSAGSHIHDWSFRRLMLENKYKFAEVLHRV